MLALTVIMKILVFTLGAFSITVIIISGHGFYKDDKAVIVVNVLACLLIACFMATLFMI